MQTESKRLKASLLALLPANATAADPESKLLLEAFAEVTAVLNQRLHQRGSSLLLGLDRDIVINCLEFVPHMQLPMVSQVCSLLANCAMHDELWSTIYKRTFGGPPAGCNQFLPGSGSIQCLAYRAFVQWNQISDQSSVVLLNAQKPHHINKAARGSQKVKAKKGVSVSSCREGAVLDFGEKIDVGYSVPYGAELGLGIEDFTVEGWYRIDQKLKNKRSSDGECECYMMMSFGWLADNMQGLDLYTTAAWHPSHLGSSSEIDGDEEVTITSDGKVFLKSTHPCCVYTSPAEKFWQVCDGQFHHFAHCRSKGMLRLYQDGELVSAAPFTEVVDPQENLFVGSTNNDGQYHPSEVAEFSIIRGQARYCGNFTPVLPFNELM